MISVTRLNGEKLFINAELIEFVEATPDTVVSLTTGKKLVIKEEVDVIVQAVINYKQLCYHKSVVEPVENV